MGGRIIGFYLLEENVSRGDRYELTKPRLDIDFGFDVRINQDLRAYLLANIDNEAENVEFWQTRLNFDRGSLTLDNQTIYLQAWDNVGVTTWDDPLHLVGDVGIYQHDFGFDQAGARVRKEIFGFDARLLYSDNAEGGESGHPDVRLDDLIEGDAIFLNDMDQFEFAVDEALSYGVFDNANTEDVLAARITRSFESFLGGRWRPGLTYRTDRGYHPGSVALLETDPPGSIRTGGDLFEYSSAFEEWQGIGGDLRYERADGIRVDGQLLFGEAWIEAREGERFRAELTTEPLGDTWVAEVVEEGDGAPTEDRTFDLDQSVRAYLGVGWVQGPLGFDWNASWEYEDHSLEAVATGLSKVLDNRMSVWRAGGEKSWERLPLLGREGALRASFEYFDFDYDPLSTWDTQFWFDRRNFWLESNEHEVSFDRLTLLGGRDALLWYPELRLRLEDRHEVDFTYRAKLGSQGFDRQPIYWESLFILQGAVARDWRATIDTRVVRYDAPVLELKKTYGETFLELAYMPAQGVSVALSFGVDPFAIDEPVNEYAYVGRDLFLFAEGANGENAESNYRNMGNLIRRAEEKLEKERRFQLEAIVSF
jgi:hypothetical protein